MTKSRRLEEMRKAFARRDVQASALAHAPERIAQEQHGGASDVYIGNMVYGGLDGILTTFAVVSGVAGAKLGSGIVLILGMANLLADGFAMAIGAYLSSKSEKEYYQREWQREAWEVEHFPEGERAELYEVYRSHSYSEEDARSLVDIQARDPERWVKAMMINELGMLQDERKPLFSALATLVSFILAGFMPLIVYVLGLFYPISSTESFTVSVILSALTIFGLGVAKVTVTKLNPFRSGLEMLLVGGLAASVAYVVGALFLSTFVPRPFPIP